MNRVSDIHMEKPAAQALVIVPLANDVSKTGIYVVTSLHNDVTFSTLEQRVMERAESVGIGSGDGSAADGSRSDWRLVKVSKLNRALQQLFGWGDVELAQSTKRIDKMKNLDDISIDDQEKRLTDLVPPQLLRLLGKESDDPQHSRPADVQPHAWPLAYEAIGLRESLPQLADCEHDYDKHPENLNPASCSTAGCPKTQANTSRFWGCTKCHKALCDDCKDDSTGLERDKLRIIHEHLNQHCWSLQPFQPDKNTFCQMPGRVSGHCNNPYAMVCECGLQSCLSCIHTIYTGHDWKPVTTGDCGICLEAAKFHCDCGVYLCLPCHHDATNGHEWGPRQNVICSAKSCDQIIAGSEERVGQAPAEFRQESKGVSCSICPAVRCDACVPPLGAEPETRWLPHPTAPKPFRVQIQDKCSVDAKVDYIHQRIGMACSVVQFAQEFMKLFGHTLKTMRTQKDAALNCLAVHLAKHENYKDVRSIKERQTMAEVDLVPSDRTDFRRVWESAALANCGECGRLCPDNSLQITPYCSSECADAGEIEVCLECGGMLINFKCQVCYKGIAPLPAPKKVLRLDDMVSTELRQCTSEVEQQQKHLDKLQTQQQREQTKWDKERERKNVSQEKVEEFCASIDSIAADICVAEEKLESARHRMLHQQQTLTYLRTEQGQSEVEKDFLAQTGRELKTFRSLREAARLLYARVERDPAHVPAYKRQRA